MSQQKPKYAFTERFTLNNKNTVDLSYGRVGGSVDDKAFSLEDAVAEYTVAIFQSCGIDIEDINTIEKYGEIDSAISQDSLLGKTLFGSVLDRNLEGLRSLLGEVRKMV